MYPVHDISIGGAANGVQVGEGFVDVIGRNHTLLLWHRDINLVIRLAGRVNQLQLDARNLDFEAIGKGLGGGILPLAAVLVREELNVAPDRAVGHYTHEKNPVSARAGLTTIEIIEGEGLVENAATLGAFGK